jgi:hypothetical protein
VPMLHTRGTLDDVSLADNYCRLTSLLVIADAFGDDQDLPTRVDMPIELRAGIMGGDCNAGIERGVADVELIQPDVACMVLCGR